VTIDTTEVSAPVVVGKTRPWPGLDAFTEALSPFFFGRNVEADELFRHVRRDFVTLLFGQSGLGKTSLLQAGLFPRLRWADFLPILIRLDHSPGAPAPAAQVKAAIEREVSAANLSEVTPIGAEESLWGYFHRADRRLADYAGEKIVPVLVFDQFEEIFTQGLANDDRRATTQDFLGELAELVENRPPEALERAIEADPDLVESFSFDRQDYRIVLALREDFLASLESLRSRAPSLGRNRYRLRRMSGRQGLDAILNPAPGLVAPEVAQEIIRFIGRASAEEAFGIAGDAAEGFEVEPPLLSLVCRELNERRIARELDQIGADLLAGSRDEIIEGFYDRCLADQPEALRAFVEDRLLSDFGYRESVTLDSARRALSDAGVPAGALDELVRRRLLRTEERLGVPRVEIIHDVLTPVIRKSRDTRRLRQEEAAEAERKAALHYDRYRRAQLRRARCLAAAMTLLALVTVALAWWGWASNVEAERQRAAAEEFAAIAQQQRAAAEKLAAIAQQQRAAATAYRTSLDTLLNSVEKDPSNLQWQRDLSISRQRIGATLMDQGDLAGALAQYRAALDINQRLAEKDPGDTQWQHDLSITHQKMGAALVDQGDLAGALAQYRANLEIVQRLAEKDPHNAQWQLDLLLTYEKIGLVASQRNNFPGALDAFEKAEKIALRLKEINPTAASSAQDLDRVQAQLEETRRKIAASAPAGTGKK
jgi:tetratricopeptide (TPR) repeat protein